MRIRRGFVIAGEWFCYGLGIALMIPVAFAIVRVLSVALAGLRSDW